MIFFLRYGDLSPITPVGRGLACLAAIYGITIVSMLVSVLVGRYQRVYNRKRFFNEEYSENMMFDDTCNQLKSTDEYLQRSIDIGKAFQGVPESDEENIEEDHDKRSGKVRFIIGYVSDEDNDSNQDKNDGDENEFITKVAQELFQCRTNKSYPTSRANLQS